MSSSASVLGRIFICYRREDTAFPAGWLFDRLAAHFGEEQVFKDIDTIKPGEDFVEMIRSAVASCDVLLALIGDRWLTITGEDGQRRLDDPGDFVRLEIQAALARNIRVIPVLVGDAQMPGASELPHDLAKLADRQACELSPAHFDSDTGKLLRVLDSALPGGMRGRLELPGDGDQVGGCIEVRGHVTGWRHDCKLWIAHRRQLRGAFWVKHPEIRPDDRGDFLVSVFEGGPGGRVVISLLAVPVSRSRYFEEWLQNGEMTGRYPGISPTSADSELDNVTVSYNPDA